MGCLTEYVHKHQFKKPTLANSQIFEATCKVMYALGTAPPSPGTRTPRTTTLENEKNQLTLKSWKAGTFAMPGWAPTRPSK